MRIMWIFFRPLKRYLDVHGIEDRGVSWIESIYAEFCKISDVQLSICFPLQQKEETNKENLDGINYYSVKKEKNYSLVNQRIIDRFKSVFYYEKPDIIHIWGTEFPQVLCAFEAAEQMDLHSRVVISLQGICSAIGEHYYAGVPFHISHGFSMRDLLKWDSLLLQKKGFEKRATYERHVLCKAKYVIGRTDYDYAYSTIVNRNIKYFKCNETLRQVFYANEWDYAKCVKHRILVSQGYYPLKGIHFVIEAVSKIVSIYPDIEVVIAGPDIVRYKQRTGYIKGSGYAHFIRRLIKSKRLQGKIHFIGIQEEEEMCKRYLESNLFISASSTENESNSLGEAKLLGMPVIASFVGGVSDRIKHKEDGLAYQYDDTTILASYICTIFDNPELAIAYGKKARMNELQITDLKGNCECLLDIYHSLFSDIQ